MRLIISFYIVIILILIGAPLYFSYAKAHTTAYVTDSVVKTERVVDTTGRNARYIIFGQHETYEDVDSWWYWKFNSSDIYGAIQPGHTYRFFITGWRVPFLSWYRNIITYKLIK
jgi:hypothetical protein